MQFVSLGWMEEAVDVLSSPEAAGITVVNEPGSNTWTQGGGREGLERTWYVIDLAVRGLMSDEPIHTTYPRPERRLSFGDVRRTLSDEWRQTFYDAWGVAPPG